MLGKTGILEFWTAWVGSYYFDVGVFVWGWGSFSLPLLIKAQA